MKILRILHGPGMALVHGVNGMARSKRTSGATRFARERVLARLRSSDEGNALVEFTLVLPILLMVLLGIFVVGIAINNQLVLTNAVGAGANYLQQISSASQGQDPCALVTAQINAATTTFPSHPTITIKFNGATEPANCPVYLDTVSRGTQLTVKGTYSCNLVIYGHDFSPGCQLVAVSSQPDTSSNP
jgi:Flp pilus assembly protein TadG